MWVETQALKPGGRGCWLGWDEAGTGCGPRREPAQGYGRSARAHVHGVAQRRRDRARQPRTSRTVTHPPARIRPRLTLRERHDLPHTRPGRAQKFIRRSATRSPIASSREQAARLPMLQDAIPAGRHLVTPRMRCAIHYITGSENTSDGSLLGMNSPLPLTPRNCPPSITT